MRGWSVFTRPPSISGDSVRSSTGVTAIPTFCRKAAVPPLATSSQSSSASPSRELVEPRLVVDGDQRAHSSRTTTSGSSRCSTAWMRSRSVSAVSPAAPGTAPGDHRARCRRPRRRVDGRRRSSRDAGRERVLDRVRARELRQQRRVDVDDPAREALEEACGEELHVAGADDELDAVLLEPVGHRQCRAPRGRRSRRARRRGRDPGRARRARARARLGPVRGDRGDRQAGVDQRLQVRALAADEHADHARSTIRPITSCPSRPAAGRHDRAVADAEVEDAAQLLLLDMPRQPREHRRPLPRVPVDLGAQAVGEHAREVAGDPAAGDVRESQSLAAQARARRRGRAASARAGRGRRSPRPRAPAARA